MKDELPTDTKDDVSDKMIRTQKCMVENCNYSTRWRNLASHMKKHHGDTTPRYSRRYSGINKR